MITEVQEKLYKSHLLGDSNHCATVLLQQFEYNNLTKLKTMMQKIFKIIRRLIQIHGKISQSNYANVRDSSDPHNQKYIFLRYV